MCQIHVSYVLTPVALTCDLVLFDDSRIAFVDALLVALVFLIIELLLFFKCRKTKVKTITKGWPHETKQVHETYTERVECVSASRNES